MNQSPKVPPPTMPLPDEPAVLPEQTRDDLDDDWRERPQDDDDRFNAERPPHWE